MRMPLARLKLPIAQNGDIALIFSPPDVHTSDFLFTPMNPDRATLNFLNSFPEDARRRGDMLQKDGAVTQIFGNHLFIQGRVEDESGTFRTSLRLQGNRW